MTSRDKSEIVDIVLGCDRQGADHALDDGGRLVIKKDLTRIAIAAEEGWAIPAVRWSLAKAQSAAS